MEVLGTAGVSMLVARKYLALNVDQDKVNLTVVRTCCTLKPKRKHTATRMLMYTYRYM